MTLSRGRHRVHIASASLPRRVRDFLAGFLILRRKTTMRGVANTAKHVAGRVGIRMATLVRKPSGRYPFVTTASCSRICWTGADRFASCAGFEGAFAGLVYGEDVGPLRGVIEAAVGCRRVSVEEVESSPSAFATVPWSSPLRGGPRRRRRAVARQRCRLRSRRAGQRRHRSPFPSPRHVQGQAGARAVRREAAPRT